ncbi:MAG: amidohydrolase family protein, partial [Bryobacteraceae bacterium]
AGPTIHSCGPLVDGVGSYHPYVAVELDDPAAAQSLVQSLKQQGAECLKVYFLLRPPVLRSVVAAAHQAGLRVTGHIGVRTSWGQALDAGIDGFNHIRTWADFLPLSEQPQGENESLDGQKNQIPRMQADWSQIDPESARVTALLDRMAAAKIGFDPTLSIQQIGDSYRKAYGLEQYAKATQSYARMSRFVARAVEKKVPLLAGTDDGSLYDELEAYAKAGVPVDTILKSATSAGADWLGDSAQFGTLTAGKRGDLILVEGDPTKDVHDLRKILTVVQAGRVVFQK